MNPITFQIIKVASVRTYMVVTRFFVFFALLHAHYYWPHWSLIAAMCISLPFAGLAVYNCIETIRLYANIRPNIDKVQADIKNSEAKAKNKEYLAKLRK